MFSKFSDDLRSMLIEELSGIEGNRVIITDDPTVEILREESKMSPFVKNILAMFPGEFKAEDVDRLDPLVVDDLTNRIEKCVNTFLKLKRIKRSIERKEEGSSNQLKEIDVFNKKLDKFQSQNNHIRALVQREIKNLRYIK